MIAYAIDGAFASGLFDRVVVSTDDDEIAAFAEARGADLPFRRPAALADDHAGTAEVVAHAIQACRGLGWRVDQVCCIYPGVPLLQAADLAAALALLDPARAEYVFPVTAFPSAIQRALRRAPDGRSEPITPQYTEWRSQDLEPAFHDAGQFYWAAADTWLTVPGIHTSARTLVLPHWRVVDIDTPDDWRRAEALCRLFAEGALA
jgi:pseudaminic acid cytidylyltransferase